ncbi:MAG: hypothetical protein J7621_01960 [Niastella sp.]|nr:hypothetical protein [Niastella sp.]
MNRHRTSSLLHYLFVSGIVFCAACSDAAYEPEFGKKEQEATGVLPTKIPSKQAVGIDSISAQVVVTDDRQVENKEPETGSSLVSQVRSVSGSRSGVE